MVSKQNYIGRAVTPPLQKSYNFCTYPHCQGYCNCLLSLSTYNCCGYSICGRSTLVPCSMKRGRNKDQHSPLDGVPLNMPVCLGMLLREIGHSLLWFVRHSSFSNSSDFQGSYCCYLCGGSNLRPESP